jgi:hypothetical protein
MLELRKIMPTIYIKTIENSECEITNFKDVTIVTHVSLFKRIFKRIKYMSFNYMSFDINNIGEHEFDNVEIILPFYHSHITDLRPETIRCEPSPACDKLTKLSFKMENPLKKGGKYNVKIGFKEILPKSKEELILHLYNLRPIEEGNRPDVSSKNYPSICSETMKLYVVLPKPLKKDSMYPPVERDNKSDDNNNLRTEIFGFFNKPEMLNEENFHEIFEWNNKQLLGLGKKFLPTDGGGRVVTFEFKRRYSISIFGFDLSYGTIGIALSFLFSIIRLFKC